MERKAEYSPRAKRLLGSAEQEAENQKEERTGTEHILIAMLKETDSVATRLLYTMGVKIFRNCMLQFLRPWDMMEKRLQKR